LITLFSGCGDTAAEFKAALNKATQKIAKEKAEVEKKLKETNDKLEQKTKEFEAYKQQGGQGKQTPPKVNISGVDIAEFAVPETKQIEDVNYTALIKPLTDAAANLKLDEAPTIDALKMAVTNFPREDVNASNKAGETIIVSVIKALAPPLTGAKLDDLKIINEGVIKPLLDKGAQASAKALRNTPDLPRLIGTTVLTYEPNKDAKSALKAIKAALDQPQGDLAAKAKNAVADLKKLQSHLNGTFTKAIAQFIHDSFGKDDFDFKPENVDAKPGVADGIIKKADEGTLHSRHVRNLSLKDYLTVLVALSGAK